MRLPPAVAAVAGLLLAALAVVGPAGPASAHAALIGSDPAQGAVVTTAPHSVTLRFDENIRTHSQVIVTGPDGRRADHGATRIIDNRAEVAVSVRYAGTYTIAYRVISADGHPVAATRTFRFDAPGAPEAPGPSRSAAGPSASAGSGHRPVLLVTSGVVVLGLAGGLWAEGTRRRRARRAEASWSS